MAILGVGVCLSQRTQSLEGLIFPNKVHWKYFRGVVPFPAVVSLWQCWGGTLVVLPCLSALLVLLWPAGAQQDFALGVFRKSGRCEIPWICRMGVASTPDIPGFPDQDPNTPRNCQKLSVTILKSNVLTVQQKIPFFSAESCKCLPWLGAGFLLSTLGKQTTLSIFSFPVLIPMNHLSNEKIHPGEALALLKVWFKEDTWAWAPWQLCLFLPALPSALRALFPHFSQGSGLGNILGCVSSPQGPRAGIKHHSGSAWV